jgi:S-layer protein
MITAPGVETVNITATDTTVTSKVASTHTATFALTDAADTTVNVAGNYKTVALTISDLSLTTVVNAGTLTGGLSTDLSAAAKALTVTGGTGADTLTLGNVKGNTVSTGDGNDTVTIGTGGSNTVALGNGNDTLKVGGAGNTIDAGAGNDTIELTAATGNSNNVVALSGGADTIKLDGVSTNGQSYDTVTGFIKGDVLDLSALNIGTSTWTSTKVSLASTAVFQDFLDAVAAGDGSANAHFGWFQWNGDTYVVEDRSLAPTFQNGTDLVIKLTGVVDLSKAVVTTGGVITGG